MIEKKKKKNLLIIVPHLNNGGAERCAANLSIIMDDKYEVSIVTFFSDSVFKNSYEYTGTLYSIHQYPTKSRIRKVINVLQRILFLRKFKKKHNIDLSVSYLFNSDIANILSKRKDKTIIAISTYLSANLGIVPIKRWIKRIYPKADQLVALNPRGEKDLIENFNIPARKTRVIPNFYDSKDIQEKYDSPVPEWNDTEKYIKLIQFGRLSHPKGQWHLLRIFKHTLTDVPNARLVIAGNGELKDYLLDYAATLALKVQDLSDTEDKTPDFEQYHVVLLGFHSNPFKFIRVSDLFLFTSVYEGFPNALAETMICGGKVLSSDCTTGPRELIAPDIHHIENYPLRTDYGVLFPNFNGEKIPPELPILAEEQLWIDTIKTYAKDTTIFDDMGEKAKERMREYDKNEVRRMWINILEE